MVRLAPLGKAVFKANPYSLNFRMNQPHYYIAHHGPYGGRYQLPFGGNVVVMLSQQQYANGHQQYSDHSRIAYPTDVSSQLQNGFRMMHNEINDVGIRPSTREANHPPQPLVHCRIKQRTHSDMEMDSNNKFCCRQNCVCSDRKDEDVNNQKSTETGVEVPVGKEINSNIAKCIEYLITNRQSDGRFRSMYEATHHPANVAALREVQLNSGGKTEGKWTGGQTGVCTELYVEGRH